MSISIDKIEEINSIVLCKLNKQPIGELPTSCIVSIERKIDEVPKIILKINKYIIQQDNKNKINNPMYYEIKNKRYLLINDEEYFIIDNIKESKISGSKEITAYGGQQILAKFPIEIEDIGIQLISNDIDQDVYSLNDFLNEIGWSVGYVDDTVAYEDIENKIEKLRWQENINNNMLDFIREDIAEQFNCLPIFDAINRTVDLIDLDLLGDEIKICLCKDNYLKSKEKHSDSDELITLLKLKGSEELDIGRYVPTGYDFITDFSYFINTREMSNGLIQALAKYDEMVAIRMPQWRALVDEKTAKETELTINRNKWQICISTIEMHKNLINRYILKDMVIEENEERVKLSEQLDNELILRLKIESLVEEITLLEQSIYNINELCKYPTCTDENGNLIFNKALLDELLEFVFIDTYSDDSFVDADAMLEKGRSILEEKSSPTISITVDSINFMSRIIDNNFRLKWNGTLSFGDIIVLIDEDSNEEEFYYFIGFSINYEDNTLTLEISNKKSCRDNCKTINKWLKESKKTKMLLLNNRYLFNKTKKYELNMENREIK